MVDTLIIGEGPGGLSAALFLARGEQEVVVYGEGKTAMRWAQLNNYLGIASTHGLDFQNFSRQQVQSAGASIQDVRITALERSDDGFVATTKDGDRVTATHVILSEGRAPKLGKALGLDVDEDGVISVDRNGLSSIPGVYVVGRSTRPGRSQAIISAGDGAAAALDILSRIAGESVCDWDSPPSDA